MACKCQCRGRHRTPVESLRASPSAACSLFILVVAATVLQTAALDASHMLNAVPLMSSGDGTQAKAAAGVVHPLQYGVHSAELTGPLLLQNGSTVVARFHIYYKAVAKGDDLVVRAQVHVFDSIRDPLQDARTGVLDKHGKEIHFTFPYHEPPEYVSHLAVLPNFYLQPAHYSRALSPEAGVGNVVLDHKRVATLDEYLIKPAGGEGQHGLYEYERSYNTTIPYLMEATLPKSEQLAAAGVTDFYLCVTGWTYCSPVSLPLLRASAPQYRAPSAAEAASPGFVTVYQTMYFGHFELSAHLLEVHVRYHKELGFTGAMLYERGSYLPQLLGHAGLSALMQAGMLRVMMWTPSLSGAPPTAWDKDQAASLGSYGMVYDQDVVYNHAALAHWGLNTYMYFADVDDFLVLGRGQTLPQIVRPGGGVCGSYFEDAQYLQFVRWNYWCEGPLSTLTEALATPDRAAGSLPPSRHHGCVHRNAEQRDKPKVVVHADASAYYEIHYGFVFEPALEKARWLPEDCSTIAHLYNLRNNRSSAMEKDTVLNREWLWPMEQQVQQASTQAAPAAHAQAATQAEAQMQAEQVAAQQQAQQQALAQQEAAAQQQQQQAQQQALAQQQAAAQQAQQQAAAQQQALAQQQAEQQAAAAAATEASMKPAYSSGFEADSTTEGHAQAAAAAATAVERLDARMHRSRERRARQRGSRPHLVRRDKEDADYANEQAMVGSKRML